MCAFTYFLMIEDIIYKSDDVILQLVEKDCILDSSIASISFLLSTREHDPWFWNVGRWKQFWRKLGKRAPEGRTRPISGYLRLP